MIEKMTRYSFILLNGDKEGFLGDLRELGVMDIRRSLKPVDERSGELLQQIEDIKAEIKLIDKGEDAHLASLLSERKALAQEAENVLAWGEYDRQALESLEGVSVKYYCTDLKRFDPAWAESYPLEVIFQNEKKVWFVVLNSEDFPVKDIPAPARTYAEVQEEILAADDRIKSYKAHLEDRKGEIPGLEERKLALTNELNMYLATIAGEVTAEDSLCVFEGFAPTDQDEALKEKLDSMPVVYFQDAAQKEDKPPIKLKNNSFSKNFEVFTGMYGLPAYDEFDPTVFLSIFYLLFFAMCMGDAGYGILLMLIALALKGKPSGLGKLYKLIFILGAGTFVVGLFLGSFFGINLTEVSWIPDAVKKCMVTGEVAGYSAQMVLSLIIGVLHISLAMIVKSVWTVRRQGLKNSLSTIGWTLLIVGTVITATITIAGLVSETTAKWIIIGIAVLSCLGIFIFNKIGRNPLINIGSGLWDTYNMASGLMGDTLSYIRLYALGLSGSMLGSTFNDLAVMIKGCGVPGLDWVGFLLLVIIGHALNLALSALGAFVHPLRLNFVEFFKNSGYEGTGKGYKPLAIEKQ